ncbi:hypothetical protein [Stenotrophomonas sp. PD6]|uniref:hypothetical protein n=1 Tax=Stenotrophomonas sp. PD6 TaxID=3368612 RepID=UPI003BA0AE33
MKRKLNLLALCALTLTLAGCGKIQEELAASQNPFPKSSPLHAPVDRVTRKLIHEPAYLERMKGLKPGQAQEMGAMLAMNGLGRLELPMLERRAQLVGQLLQKLPEAQCGEIAKATTPAEVSRTTDRMLETLATMPQGAIDEWFDIAYAATVAELQQLPKKQVTEAQVNAAAVSLVQLIPTEAERERIGTVMSNLPGATPADACWAVRTMYTTLPKLPEPERGHFAWASTQQ